MGRIRIFRVLDEEDFCDIYPVVKAIFPSSQIRFSDKDVYFYARVKKEVVGFSHVFDKGGGTYVLQGIGVLPKFRNRGIGGKLADKAIKFCEQKGALRILLRVRCTNPAVLLYLKKGFYLKKESFGSYTLERRKPS
ncbi:MAG: GNAT family N-acetyltransferase [Candidatus Anstonellales archaeon]